MIHMKRTILISIIYTLICSCLSGPPSYAPKVSSTQTTKAVTDYKHKKLVNYGVDALLISHNGYLISYDEENLIPHWVSYTLSSCNVISTPPPSKPNFQQDPKCIDKKQADYSDYKKSGWSRGHMAPAADFKWSVQAYEETYVYTNCCPQNAELNNGSWNILENKIRKWALEYGEIDIVTGPIIGDNHFGALGKSRVTIPNSFFKAVLVKVDGNESCVGFVMNNTTEKQSLLDSFVSINKLESITSIDFFPEIDDNNEDVIESIVDRSIWHF